jgi:hypothetical protein
MSHSSGEARRSALVRWFVRLFRGERVRVKAVNRAEVLIRIARNARRRTR